MSSCVFYFFLFYYLKKKSGKLYCFADLVCSDLGSEIIFLGYNPTQDECGPAVAHKVGWFGSYLVTILQNGGEGRCTPDSWQR